MALPTAAALPGAQEQMAFTKPDICVINSFVQGAKTTPKVSLTDNYGKLKCGTGPLWS